MWMCLFVTILVHREVIMMESEIKPNNHGQHLKQPSDNTTMLPEMLGTAAHQRILRTTSYPPLVFKVLSENDYQPSQLSSRAPRETYGESKSSAAPTSHYNPTLIYIVVMLLTRNSLLSLIGILTISRNLLLCIILTSQPCHASTDDTSITVFDTSGAFSNQSVNLKIISLLNVGTCTKDEVESNYQDPKQIPVQVVRLGLATPVEITNCLVKYTVKLSHCESNVFRSDIYPPVILEKNRIKEIDIPTCLTMGKTRTFSFNLHGKTILLPGLTSSSQYSVISLVGTQKSDGGCEGKKVEAAGNVYESAVIHVEVEAYVRPLLGLFTMEQQMIRIKNVIQFSTSSHQCDSELGCFAFNIQDLPRTRCEKTTELFLGTATFHNVEHSHYTPIVTITSNTQSSQGVSLTLNSKIILCKQEVWSTNIDGIFINKLPTNDSTFALSHRLSKKNVEPTDYQEEAKLLDLLGTLSSAVTEVALASANQFSKIAQELCMLRRTDLQLMLSDLANLPARALLNYRRGLLFKRSASVVYVYVGIARRARLRHTQTCYEEIPISFKDDFGNTVEAFATSKARVLVTNGTMISCQSGRPMHFIPSPLEETQITHKEVDFLDEILNPSNTLGNWLCQSPSGFHTCADPTILRPTISEDFKAMPKHFMSQNLFGLEGRKRLYTGQVESHSRSVMVTRWNKIWMGDVEASPRDLFLNQLSQQAATDLQRAVFPVLAMMTDAVGLFEKLEAFLLIMYMLNVLAGLFFLIARFHIMLSKYGFSVKLFLAVSNQMYQIIIPWVKLKSEMRDTHGELKASIDQLRNEILRRSAGIKDQLEKDVHDMRSEIIQINRRVDVFLVSAAQHLPNLYPDGLH